MIMSVGVDSTLAEGGVVAEIGGGFGSVHGHVNSWVAVGAAEIYVYVVVASSGGS